MAEPGSVMASKTPLMPRERAVERTEVCIIYSLILYVGFTVKENTSGDDKLPAALASKSSLKLENADPRGEVGLLPVQRWFNTHSHYTQSGEKKPFPAYFMQLKIHKYV